MYLGCSLGQERLLIIFLMSFRSFAASLPSQTVRQFQGRGVPCLLWLDPERFFSAFLYINHQFPRRAAEPLDGSVANHLNYGLLPNGILCCHSTRFI
jgi:hypothetical protein